ncbi:MAG: hypothetical protein HZA50_10230 [Planctomycetes bacterium]|nr:hypothetical protein [Planctomycetota bacterium]
MNQISPQTTIRGAASAGRGGPEGIRNKPEAIAWCATLLGLLLAVLLIAQSDGFYQDDDICHYQFARDGWYSPTVLLHTWARPGLTLPMSLIVHFFGLLGGRLLSAAMTAATAYFAYRIARRILQPAPGGAYFAALAPLLVWLGPLNMTLALTTLTETPAAFYLTLATWLYMRGNRVIGCLVFSLAFVTRYEIAALAPVLAAVLARDSLRDCGWKIMLFLNSSRFWLGCFALAAAPAVYAFAAIWYELPPAASPLHIFDGARDKVYKYGTGSWLHFLVNWVTACGPGVIILWAAGAAAFMKRAALPVLLSLGLVAIETILYRFGLFASGGYDRFLVPIGGLTAAVAAAGIAAMLPDRGRPGEIRHRRLRATTLTAAAVFICAYALFAIRPLTISASGMHSLLRDGASQACREGGAGNAAITCHVAVRMLWKGPCSILWQDSARSAWDSSPPGTVFFWETEYCAEPTKTLPPGAMQAILARSGRKVFSGRKGRDAVEVYIKESPSRGPASRGY